MKVIAVIIFFSSVVAAYAVPRIIGGKDAPDGKYPYMVSLRIDSNIHFCGGSILNNRWILTAGHCLFKRLNDSVTVVAGTNLIEGGDEQVYQSEFVIMHKNWNNPALSNDVGLIRVDRNIDFNDKVQPIELTKENFNKVSYPATLSGWGYTELSGIRPNTLQEITLKVTDQNECKKQYDGLANITESHICTFTTYGEGACNGDSGSPLVIDGVQIGVASFVRPCARGYPDVFARVYTFLNWINAQFAKF